MNYSENQKSIRNSSSEYENNGQLYQNSKRSNMPKRPQQKQYQDNNKSTNYNHSYQQSDGQSRLNFNSTPFTPKQQSQNFKGPNNMAPDKGTEPGRVVPRVGGDHVGNYYQQAPNINYEQYGGNMPNQYAYNAVDLMPYICQLTNSGSAQNYWPMMPNSGYFEIPNLGLSSNVEPSQNMFMIGKNSENSFTVDNNLSSANIQSNPQQFVHNKRHNPATVKHSGNDNNDTQGSATLDRNIAHLNNLQLDAPNFSRAVTQNPISMDQSPDAATYNAILNCLTEPQIKKELSESLKTINPKILSLKTLPKARFFVIKSYSEDDLHRAIKYGCWCSTKLTNDRLNEAYKKLTNNQDNGRLFLFFSVNGSGFFAGIAEMISPVNPNEVCGFWTQTKWIGKFRIKWHYVKDVRNNSLRHIRSESNENKPVTNSRDGVEVTPSENGIEFIKVFHNAKHETSVFDDFEHYEQRQNNPNSQ